MPIDRSTPPLSSLFQDLILEHYKRPRNHAPLENPDREAHVRNPTCGDDVNLALRIDDQRIEDARFLGSGCSISQASASMMTERIKGRSITEANDLANRFTAMMRGDAEAATDPALGDLRALAGVAKFPLRVRCALLPWDALAAALARPGEDEGP